METLNEKSISNILPKRRTDAHKGTFGKVLVIAGSENYPGAAYLSCVAAYRVGAGLITLGTTPSVKIIVSKKLPEVTFFQLDEVYEKLNGYDVVLLGPGLGQKEETVRFIKRLLNNKLPKTVIDGDGLNILSQIDEWWKKLATEAILTPHPGEMGRLTGLSVDTIQERREELAKQFSKKWKQVVILKGANTVVASPAGEVKLAPFANPALATAGTGDVLAGCIAGFLAQGLGPFDAACVGVYVHGMAAELIRKNLGDAGMIASDLLPALPLALFTLHTQT